ncbi:hypothetical protein A2U01_0119146, partial [Trifolium medium]|nr:hypothetical protein [Trifolium medium]
ASADVLSKVLSICPGPSAHPFQNFIELSFKANNSV